MPECYIDTNLLETIVPPEKIGNNLLANWIKYLKEHPYNADSLELINL